MAFLERVDCSIVLSKLMELFADITKIAFSQGMAKPLYGAAIQIRHMLETGGDLFSGNLKQLILRYQTMFGTANTGDVEFQLSSPDDDDENSDRNLAPPKPKAKPGSRCTETRLKPARERACSAVKGNSSVRNCGFCNMPGHKITTCQKKNAFGLKSNKDQLVHVLNKLSLQVNPENFATLPSDYVQILFSDSPRKARHLVILGVYEFEHNRVGIDCNRLVAGVTFLAEGGDVMVGYEKIPMNLSVIVKSILSCFQSDKKLVLISEQVKFL